MHSSESNIAVSFRYWKNVNDDHYTCHYLLLASWVAIRYIGSTLDLCTQWFSTMVEKIVFAIKYQAFALDIGLLTPISQL